MQAVLRQTTAGCSKVSQPGMHNGSHSAHQGGGRHGSPMPCRCKHVHASDAQQSLAQPGGRQSNQAGPWCTTTGTLFNIHQLISLSDDLVCHAAAFTAAGVSASTAWRQRDCRLLLCQVQLGPERGAKACTVSRHDGCCKVNRCCKVPGAQRSAGPSTKVLAHKILAALLNTLNHHNKNESKEGGLTRTRRRRVHKNTNMLSTTTHSQAL